MTVDHRHSHWSSPKNDLVPWSFKLESHGHGTSFLPTVCGVVGWKTDHVHPFVFERSQGGYWRLFQWLRSSLQWRRLFRSNSESVRGDERHYTVPDTNEGNLVKSRPDTYRETDRERTRGLIPEDLPSPEQSAKENIRIADRIFIIYVLMCNMYIYIYINMLNTLFLLTYCLIYR